MTKKVIFVCMGNSCRSPMAEAFFRQRVEEECISYDTSSRGLRATDGGRAAPEGIQVMGKDYGIDISNHRRATLTKLDIDSADIIVPLDSMLNEVLLQRNLPAEKLVFLRHINDPYGGDIHRYEQCAAEIKEMVDAVVANILS